MSLAAKATEALTEREKRGTCAVCGYLAKMDDEDRTAVAALVERKGETGRYIVPEREVAAFFTSNDLPLTRNAVSTHRHHG